REELAAQTVEELYGAALALWKFSAERKPGRAKLRVYNPRMAEHGWTSRHTIVEIINDDMPFLVDSTAVLMAEQGHGIHALIHPMLSVARDGSGRRSGLGSPGGEGVVNESVIQLQIDQIGDRAAIEALRAGLERLFVEIGLAVRDWRAMLARLAETAETLQATATGAATGAGVGAAPESVIESVTESVAFLEWLGDNHFTFLGCRAFRLDGDAFHPVPDSGLGLLSDPDFTVMRDHEGHFAHWTPDVEDVTADPHPLLIIKANRRSTIHRGTHFDVVAIKQYGPDGAVVGEQVFVGLFTSAAYNRSPHEIPMLSEKMARIIARAGFRPSSHDGKALDNVLETYPRDELFQSTDDQLFESAMGVLHLATRPRPRLFMRPDRFQRFVSCIVYVPRERYTTELRMKIGSIICQAVQGRVASWEPSFDLESMARVHFVIALTGGGGVPDYDVAELERAVIEMTRSWSDRLADTLIEREGEVAGNRLQRRFAQAFPASYRDEVPVATAAGDIEKLDVLTEEAPLSLHFYRRLEDADDWVRFKIYHRGGAVPLSDCLPVLENMGFRVIAEHPYRIDCEDAPLFLHDFEMRSATGVAIDLSKSKTRVKLEEGFA
ncbi:MAG: NAD-glutamate dehydrogenase, partial [Pseudomonadota bacterium]